LSEHYRNIIKYEQCELSLNNCTEDNNSHDMELPTEVFDAIVKTLQQQPDIQEAVKESSEEVGKTLYEIIIKSDYEHGIDNGEFIRDINAMEIRNVKTGRVVGKATLQKADIPENKVAPHSKPSPLSNITKSICSISGQMQLAEISKKIDILNEKVDEIKEQMWREKIAELNACKEIIEKARQLLPNDDALNRINENISILTMLSSFFFLEMQKILFKKIPFNQSKSFIEGLKFWEFGDKDRTEYNTDYLTKIKEFLGEYSFILDCYSHSMEMLGTCYQIVHNYITAEPIYERMHKQVNEFSSEAFNKMAFLLGINEAVIDGESRQRSLHEINELIGERNLQLNEAISDSASRIDQASYRYITLKNQFNNCEIKLILDSKLLLGEGKMNDSNGMS